MVKYGTKFAGSGAGKAPASANDSATDSTNTPAATRGSVPVAGGRGMVESGRWGDGGWGGRGRGRRRGRRVEEWLLALSREDRREALIHFNRWFHSRGERLKWS